MPKEKPTINLAVIIPTLNEQLFIGKLLDAIIKQTMQPEEIVVVDAFSKDKTAQEVKIRQKYLPQIKFFQIPKKTVARQRNFGVKKTKSPDILFLDADMEFRQKGDLEKYFKEVKTRKPEVAVAKNLPDSNHWKDRVYFEAEDMLFKLSKFFWPVITARNLYITRKIFNMVGGFNENIAVGEDQELVHRILGNGGKLIFLKKVKLHTSARRVIKDGRIRHALKMMLFGINIITRGRDKSKVDYEFGHFTTKN